MLRPSGVSSASERELRRRRRDRSGLMSGRGQKRRRHAIAERDGAGLVQKQHVHVARRFHRASAHRQHIALKHAVHARDANGAEQAADRCGNQANQQRDQNRNGKDRAGINAERFQRHADEQENERQRREQNRQRDFVRRLLALRAFDQRNHAVEKAVAFFHRDANDDAVAQHARAAGDRAAVAAAFADDRRGFAGDRRFVHAGDAFDDIAVGGNDIARFANDEVALLQIRRGNFFFAAVAQAARHGVLARFAQAGGLRFAATFRHGFGEIREEHREPEPDRELRNEAAHRRLGRENAHGGQRRADHGHEHDRVLDHQPRVELLERVADRRANNVPVKERRSFAAS